MKQMEIPEEMLLKIDWEDDTISEPAKQLRPAIWKDGNDYCCLLGPDPQVGVFGCGASTQEALLDWEEHLKNRIRKDNQDDEVTQYIVDTLKTKKSQVW